MKKILVVAALLFLVGCQSSQERRAELEQRFKEAYPSNWKAKLLEYDLKCEELAVQQRMIYMQRYANTPQYEPEPSRVYFPNAYPNDDVSDNYWQEQRAEQEYWDEYRKNTSYRYGR
jgi:hypothetical protein